MKNYDKELERLQQRAYSAMINEREQRNTLKLAQQAQTSCQPAPAKPTAQPVKPVRPDPPQPPKQPMPQQPAAPLYQSSSLMPKREKAFLVWASREHVCKICLVTLWGEEFLNAILMKGLANGLDVGKNVAWVTRIDEPDIRCSVCTRRVHQE